MLVLAVAGCAKNPVAVEAEGLGGKTSEALAKASSKVIGGPLVPDVMLQPTPSIAYPLEKLVYWGLWVGAAWLILDPLAPNWDIEETRLPQDHVHVQLKMKRYTSGGAGEARELFHRRAKQLMREGGYARYEVVEYAESLTSAFYGGQRQASGVIRLTRAAG